MASSLHEVATTITGRLRILINNDLKKILREEGLAQGGNKLALQQRLVDLVNRALNNSDVELLGRLQYRVQNHGYAPPPTSSSSTITPTYLLQSQPGLNEFPTTKGYQSHGTVPPYTSQPYIQRDQLPPRPTALFRDSPFFETRELIMGNITLEVSPCHRQNTTRTIALNDGVCQRLKSDSSLRLLIFSALEQPLAPFARCDIAFPSQIEVRINGVEVKANYKGLKNKPGSTRPVDITTFVRTTPANHRNTLIVTYALTLKASEAQKYNLFIYMAKRYTVEELVQKIKQRNLITHQSVLNEMMKKANDPDIEVRSSVMSLKDPVSTLRIQTPCRSTICSHNQCFDAESFLLLQEQAPTWTCPICNKTISYEGLAVDQYVEEILDKARDTDQVTIEPNGEWSTEKDQPSKTNGYRDHDGDSDDDLVEIPDYRIKAIKTEFAPTPTSLNTPPLPSREASTAPRSGNKRPSEVVDLTLSDDDEPARPTKKVAYSTPNSLHDVSRRYQFPSSGNSQSVSHNRPLLPAYHNNFNIPQGHCPDFAEAPQTPTSRGSFSAYRPPPTRPSYPGQGSSSSHQLYYGLSP